MTASFDVPATHDAMLTVLPSADADAAAIDTIVAELRGYTGFDVREYRRATVERRIRNRMISIDEPSYAGYARLVASSPDEAWALLERVSIKVSEFYRNPEVFDLLHAHVLRELAASAGERPLRVWSAGCARGEEPWTLAMLLHDLGIDAVVHATDIDPDALALAQRARYSQAAIGALPTTLANRYLTRTCENDEFRVDPALRSLVRFSVHNLLGDTPTPGEGSFDLICCRNVLIYFQRAAQERTFARLARALTPRGMLCVGEAEWPCGPASDGLCAAAPRIRIFHQRFMEQAA